MLGGYWSFKIKWLCVFDTPLTEIGTNWLMNKILFFKIINWLLSWRPLGSNRFWWNLMWFTTLSLTTKQPCLMNTGTEHAQRAELNGSLSGRTRAPLITPPYLVVNHMEENYQPHCCWSESVLKPGLELVSSRPGFSFLCGEKSGWAWGGGWWSVRGFIFPQDRYYC